jgi:hypothetical protein
MEVVSFEQHNVYISSETKSCCHLTLSIRTEYIYSAASHASCLDGVLILHDFHKVLKLVGTGDFKA